MVFREKRGKKPIPVFTEKNDCGQKKTNINCYENFKFFFSLHFFFFPKNKHWKPKKNNKNKFNSGTHHHLNNGGSGYHYLQRLVLVRCINATTNAATTPATATFAAVTTCAYMDSPVETSLAPFDPLGPLLEPLELARLHGPGLQRATASSAVSASCTARRYESTSVDIIISRFGIGGTCGPLATALPLPWIQMRRLRTAAAWLACWRPPTSCRQPRVWRPWGWSHPACSVCPGLQDDWHSHPQGPEAEVNLHQVVAQLQCVLVNEHQDALPFVRAMLDRSDCSIP